MYNYDGVEGTLEDIARALVAKSRDHGWASTYPVVDKRELYKGEEIAAEEVKKLERLCIELFDEAAYEDSREGK